MFLVGIALGILWLIIVTLITFIKLKEERDNE
nr:MAG TPA: Oxaloacetate decarboxylase, gamma chain [Caudoviricetes sp.]